MRFVYSWCVVALFAPQLEGRAQDAVPIHREPRHRLVLDSVRFRVLDVQIVPGDTTRFHIHDTAILYVDLAPSPVAIQILGGAWTGFTPPGSPGGRTGPVRIDSTYVLHPITHRVTNTGASTFRVLAIISSGPAPASGGDTTQTLPGTTELRSTWFRQARVQMEPGSTTEWRTSGTPVLIVQPALTGIEVELEGAARQRLESAGSW